MKKPLELFVFFHIHDPAAFTTAFKSSIIPLITSTATIISPPSSQPLAFLNAAFSQTGLTTLGVHDNLGDSHFAAGQFAEAASLGDVPDDWDSSFTTSNIHGVFLLGSDTQPNIDNLFTTITTALNTSIHLTVQLQGAARPGAQAGHERESPAVS